MLSLLALIVLSPLMVVLMIVGAVKMKGNPFFTQLRPGRNEKVFRLVKFRTMSNVKDKDGNLLPDGERLNAYGRFLRATSLDEIPEMLNILKGDMAIVGPRPLLVRYLPYYTEEERHRHDVRPGLTGLAQVNGRNLVKWDERLAYDVEYVKRITFLGDVRIVGKTVMKVLKRDDIAVDTDAVETYLDEERKEPRPCPSPKGRVC